MIECWGLTSKGAFNITHMLRQEYTNLVTQAHMLTYVHIFQSMRTNFVLANLLVTVLQSTEIKLGRPEPISGESEVGGGGSEATCCGPAGPVMWIKAAENDPRL